MPVLRFIAPNIKFSLPGGRQFTNGDQMFVEVEDPWLYDCLIQSYQVELAGKLPPEQLRRFIISRDGESDYYPLPDFRAKKTLIVGRGASSKDFWRRFPREEFWYVGVNPGSFPSGSVDETDGRHGENPNIFDAIGSLDAIYFRESSNVLDRYIGPVMGETNCRPSYNGPGTFHDLRHVAGRTKGLSIHFVGRCVVGLGGTEIVLTGTDFEGNALHLRPGMAAIINDLRKRGAEVWRDPLCPFEELGDPWED